MTSDGGPFHRDSSEMPWEIAVDRVNGLKALPACRWAWVARLNFTLSWLRPPTMARTSPVWGSMATSAAEGSPGVDRCESTAVLANRWRCTSSVVLTFNPPPNVAAVPKCFSRVWVT